MRIWMIGLCFFSQLAFADGTVKDGSVTVIEEVGSDSEFVWKDELNLGFRSVVRSLNLRLGNQPLTIRITRSARQNLPDAKRVRMVVDIEFDLNGKKTTFASYPIFEAGGGNMLAQMHWMHQTFSPLDYMGIHVLSPQALSADLLDELLGHVDIGALAPSEQWAVRQYQDLRLEAGGDAPKKSSWPWTCLNRVLNFGAADQNDVLATRTAQVMSIVMSRVKK